MELEENKFEARQPDFKGEGIAVWINFDKNGQKYLAIKILGNIRLNAFKNEPRIVDKPEL